MKVLPALKAVVAFAIGITIALWIPVTFTISLAVALTFLLLASLPLPYSLQQVVIYGLIMTTGATNFSINNNRTIPETSPLFVLCRVEEPPLIRDEFTSFPARGISAGIDSSDMVEFEEVIWVRIKSKIEPKLGAVLLLKGNLQPFREQRNLGDFNLKRWRASENIIGEFSSISIQEVKGFNKASPILRARKWLSDSCDRLALGDAPLWKGLILGFRRDIDPQFMADLRITGLTHLLALSGLNIGFLVLAFLGIGSIFRLPLSLRISVSIVLIILYAQVIPDRGSTLRATIMAIAIMLSYLFRRWTPSLNTIGLAGLLILAARPLDLFDPGFQLSFAATAGIFLFQHDISLLNSWRQSNSSRLVRLIRHWVLVPLAVSLVSSIFTAPLISYYFNLIPLASPIFNLIAVPLLGVIFAGAWLAVVLQPLGVWLSQLVADGMLTLSIFWQALTHFMAQVAVVWQYRLPPWSLFALFGLVIWGGVSHRTVRKRLLIMGLGSVAIVLFTTIRIYPQAFRALFIDVGHGDAQVWLFPDGTTWLIDAGPASINSEGRVDKVLRHLNCNSLKMIVASHSDADHIGGFSSIIDNFEIENAVRNSDDKQSETFQTLEHISLNQSINWYELSESESITGLPDGYDIKVLNPPAGNIRRSDNDHSLVMRLSITVNGSDEFTLLTTGDIQEVAEKYLLKTKQLKSDLLKIPHHGSPTSSSTEFVNAVSPSKGIISRGWGDESVSAIARLEVLDRYRSVGTDVYFTDKEGAILMEATPLGWVKVDWRHPTFSRWMRGWL